MKRFQKILIIILAVCVAVEAIVWSFARWGNFQSEPTFEIMIGEPYSGFESARLGVDLQFTFPQKDIQLELQCSSGNLSTFDGKDFVKPQQQIKGSSQQVFYWSHIDDSSKNSGLLQITAYQGKAVIGTALLQGTLVEEGKWQVQLVRAVSYPSILWHRQTVTQQELQQVFE